VRVHGHASVYERRGDLQIQAQAMRKAGKGAQQKAFEKLKRKLREEGLFEAERKQSLPAFPDTIGVVTSGQGAAIHDIRAGLGRRFPPAAVVLCPVAVQGLDAPQAIADGIAAFNDVPPDHDQHADLLIVGRGGGSTEDLWAFNEEAVARAIAASERPVVSAVGHESDVTIADLVADERAATPSTAAELVVPDRRDVAQRVRAAHSRLHRHTTRRLQDARQRVEALVSSRAFHAPARRLEQHQQHLDTLIDRLTRSGGRLVEQARTRLDRLQDRLRAADPARSPARGRSCTAPAPRLRLRHPRRRPRPLRRGPPRRQPRSHSSARRPPRRHGAFPRGPDNNRREPVALPPPRRPVQAPFFRTPVPHSTLGGFFIENG
jgi:exodeoxyribonuclease VII large subunit